MEDDNQVNKLEGGGEDEELDPEPIDQLDNDTDNEEEELLTDTDTEFEKEDGYEYPRTVDNDSNQTVIFVKMYV